MIAPLRVRILSAASLAAWLGFFVPDPATAVAAQSASTEPASATSGSPAATKVTYVSGGSVYLEAGRDHGAGVGDSAEARRGGRRIAGLVIRSSRWPLQSRRPCRSSCWRCWVPG